MNCHNGEKYLKKSIRSIISQTYKNWELIFFNNKSSDKSKYFFDTFKEPRFKYFESKLFYSLYEARNLAISKAKGKFICFLDTDDWWEKKKLKKQINLFNKFPNLKFIYSNYFVYHQSTKEKKIFSNKFLPEGFLTQKLLNIYFIGLGTVMIKKKLFKKKKFNKRYNIIGDFDLFLNISKNNIIKCIQEPLAYYRIHSNNLSSLRLDLYIREISQWVKIIKKNKDFKKYSFFRFQLFIYKLKVKKILNSVGSILQNV